MDKEDPEPAQSGSGEHLSVKSAGIFCTTDYGGSEGVYLDAYLKWYDKGQERMHPPCFHCAARWSFSKTPFPQPRSFTGERNCTPCSMAVLV